MAYARIKVWIPGETLTASDLNSEFTGCIANENDLGTKLTAEISARTTLESEHDTLRTEFDTLDGNVWDTDQIAADAVKANSIEDGVITDAKIATANKDGTAATASMRTLGTGATQAAAGNQQMTPSDSSVTVAKLASDVTVLFPVSAYAAGTNLLASADTEREKTSETSPTLCKSIAVCRSGTLRIKFSIKCVNPGGGRLAHATIYRNGAAVGTARTNATSSYVEYSEDIAGWRPMDVCQLYVWNSITQDRATVKEFRIYSSGYQTLETVTLD
jgi:hypothetical protein